MYNQTKTDKVNKWEIRLCDLGDIQSKDAGVQGGKLRPCLIMSNDNFGLTTIVMPITSKCSHRYMRSHVTIGEECGLLRESQLLAEQITTISKTRIGKKVAEIKDDKIKRMVTSAMLFTMGVGFDEVAVAVQN